MKAGGYLAAKEGWAEKQAFPIGKIACFFHTGVWFHAMLRIQVNGKAYL